LVTSNSYEHWDDVFQENNVNIIFNNFLNIYLRIYYASFPTKKIQESYKPKPWLTNGIRISCAKKRKMYVTYRSSKDPNYKVIIIIGIQPWAGLGKDQSSVR
jgi:hypothetical protein